MKRTFKTSCNAESRISGFRGRSGLFSVSEENRWDRGLKFAYYSGGFDHRFPCNLGFEIGFVACWLFRHEAITSHSSLFRSHEYRVNRKQRREQAIRRGRRGRRI